MVLEDLDLPTVDTDAYLSDDTIEIVYASPPKKSTRHSLNRHRVPVTLKYLWHGRSWRNGKQNWQTGFKTPESLWANWYRYAQFSRHRFWKTPGSLTHLLQSTEAVRNSDSGELELSEGESDLEEDQSSWTSKERCYKCQLKGPTQDTLYTFFYGAEYLILSLFVMPSSTIPSYRFPIDQTTRS